MGRGAVSNPFSVDGDLSETLVHLVAPPNSNKSLLLATVSLYKTKEKEVTNKINNDNKNETICNCDTAYSLGKHENIHFLHTEIIDNPMRVLTMRPHSLAGNQQTFPYNLNMHQIMHFKYCSWVEEGLRVNNSEKYKKYELLLAITN